MAFTLSVTNKPLMPSVVMLNVVAPPLAQILAFLMMTMLKKLPMQIVFSDTTDTLH
jgi:hypothetical protein